MNFLKEHRRGEEQDRKIQDQETRIAELRSEMKTLAERTTGNQQRRSASRCEQSVNRDALEWCLCQALREAFGAANASTDVLVDVVIGSVT